MEFNQLPEGYDAEEFGPQKRQTEFDSPEAKLAYDAQNLVAIARKYLTLKGIKADSREQILMTTCKNIVCQILSLSRDGILIQK